MSDCGAIDRGPRNGAPCDALGIGASAGTAQRCPLFDPFDREAAEGIPRRMCPPPPNQWTMRHFLTACALAAVITGVAQSTQSPAQGNAPAAKPWLNPALTYGSITDIDGNTYATIRIGTQVWMAENLRTTRYWNGDTIPNVTDDDAWSQLDVSTTGAWCHYDNNPNYEVPYGKLYNWYVVADPRNVCPTGWHLPTDAEWTVLSDHLGGASVAGGKMKSAGTWYWLVGNTGATNESGFSGLPVGFRYYAHGVFYYLDLIGYWWSASEAGADYTWGRYLDYYIAATGRNSYYGNNAFSVRCLRD